MVKTQTRKQAKGKGKKKVLAIADSLQFKQYKKEKEMIKKHVTIPGHVLARNEQFKGSPNLRKEGVKLIHTTEQLEVIRRCEKSPLYFINNFCNIVNLDVGLVKFKTRDYQRKLIRLFHAKNRVIVKFPRQSGKTVTTAAYAVWQAIFQPYAQIAILANKNMTAIGILQKVRQIYECLPVWLQIGVKEWSKGTISLENGSVIKASATSSSAIRSMSISTLIIDECAFVEAGVWEEFFASVYPTVSSSKKAKIMLISTPKGMNHFHKFWNDAVNKKETNSEFAHYEIQWNDVPGRDETFKTKVMAEFGKDYWEQEFECQFIGSAGTLIDGQYLRIMSYKNPIETKLDGCFKIYEMPVQKRKYENFDGSILKKDDVYACLVDVAGGTGNDYSTVHVFNITSKPYIQVALYRSNTVKIRDFPFVIERIAKMYNEALVIVENNSIGEAVLNDLVQDCEYENVFADKEFGIKMTSASKRIGNYALKMNIEEFMFRIIDKDTITEFNSYIRVKSSKNVLYEADKGKNDDTITPLVIFSYFLRNDLWVEQWIDQQKERAKEEFTTGVDSDLMSFMIRDDGENEDWEDVGNDYAGICWY